MANEGLFSPWDSPWESRSKVKVERGGHSSHPITVFVSDLFFFFWYLHDSAIGCKGAIPALQFGHLAKSTAYRLKKQSLVSSVCFSKLHFEYSSGQTRKSSETAKRIAVQCYTNKSFGSFGGTPPPAPPVNLDLIQGIKASSFNVGRLLRRRSRKRRPFFGIIFIFFHHFNQSLTVSPFQTCFQGFLSPAPFFWGDFLFFLGVGRRWNPQISWYLGLVDFIEIIKNTVSFEPRFPRHLLQVPTLSSTFLPRLRRIWL